MEAFNTGLEPYDPDQSRLLRQEYVSWLESLEKRTANPAQADRVQADARAAAAAFARDFAQFDGETVVAVDKFRRDHKLEYAGNPPGLVDSRFVTALRAAYTGRKKADGK